jgi:hypothetical protein
MVAGASAGVVAACFLIAGAAGCGEGGNLAVSAGAPVTAAVRGRVTRCGQALAAAQVVLAVQQDQNEQARPVNTQFGPQTTGRRGEFLFDVSPSFAVPGGASMQLEVTAAGVSYEFDGGTLEFHLGAPPRDTARFDVDLQAEPGTC